MHYTAKFRNNPPPSQSSSSCLRKSPAVPGHPVWVIRGGCRRGVLRHIVEQMADVCPLRADARCSCAADGLLAVGGLQAFGL